MKRILAVVMLLTSQFANAVVLGPGCKGFEWDYPASEEDKIDGFEMILDGAAGAKVGAAARIITCAGLVLPDGDHTFAVRAYKATSLLSANSNELAFTYQSVQPALPPPTLTKVVMVLSGAEAPPPGRNMVLQFNGAGDYFDAGYPRVDGSAISLTARVKVASFASPNHQGRIISQATSAAEQSHWWMVSLSGTSFRYRLKTGGFTTTLFGSGGADLVAGQWHHVAATYDGASMRIYQDGQEVGSTAKNGPLDVPNVSVATYIGMNPGATNSFKGQIDDVRIYSMALSPEQVARVAVGDVLPTGDLVADWDFEEGTPGDVAAGGPVYVEAD